MVYTLSEAYGADRGVAEHHGGDVAVVQLQPVLLVKDAVRQLTACSDGHWGKRRSKHFFFFFFGVNQYTSPRPKTLNPT